MFLFSAFFSFYLLKEMQFIWFDQCETNTTLEVLYILRKFLGNYGCGIKIYRNIEIPGSFCRKLGMPFKVALHVH